MAGLNALIEIKKIVGISAPIIASVLGSPAAGLAVTLLGSLFGGTSDPETILNGLTTTPNIEEQLKALEYQHGEALSKIANSDKANAREREVNIIKAGGRDWVLPALAFFFCIIYGAVQIYVIYHPDAQDDLISARLQDIMVMIISYFFGSSNK
jgi:hypothetical protein